MHLDADSPEFTWYGHWATPVYRATVPDAEALNQALLTEIVHGHQDKQFSTLGMAHGRKSDFGLLNSTSEAVATLKKAVFDAVHALNKWAIGLDDADFADSMVAEAWSVAYGQDGFHGMHVHHGSSWSGVYYVSTGSLSPGSGQIQLIDPRAGAHARGGTPEAVAHSVDPFDGLIIAFPSWLYHWVTPVDARTPRVCVAFNVGFSHFAGELLDPAGGRSR